MVKIRVVVLAALALAACDKGAKSGPDCTATAKQIETVLTDGKPSVTSAEAKAGIVKTCMDDKWTGDARTCISAAKTKDAYKDCVHDKLTGDQAEKLKKATATLGGTDFAEAMKKMREFTDKMCACKDAKCAQSVSDEMTKWGQKMAEEQKDPPKLTDEDEH